METKRCNKCGDDLPVTAFKKHRGTCIECNRKHERERIYQRYHEEPDFKKKRQAATAKYKKTEAYHKLWASDELLRPILFGSLSNDYLAEKCSNALRLSGLPMCDTLQGRGSIW